MVREKTGKSQGILLYSNCGHPEIYIPMLKSNSNSKAYIPMLKSNSNYSKYIYTNAQK